MCQSLTSQEGGGLDDIRDRLRTAALALFVERGYERTTAAQIAARAGVTERTFFRHFLDKREVLFDGEARVREALVAAVAEAPAGLDPLDTLSLAFRSLTPMLEDARSYSKPRKEVIAAAPALRERELAKVEALTAALVAALAARGVPQLRADLAARSGMAAFVHATSAWLDDPSRALGERIDLAFEELGALLGGRA